MIEVDNSGQDNSGFDDNNRGQWTGRLISNFLISR